MTRIVSGRHAHTKALEAIGDLGSFCVRSRHLVSEVGEEFGNAAHADTTDAHEMNSPCTAKHSLFLNSSRFRFRVFGSWFLVLNFLVSVEALSFLLFAAGQHPKQKNSN
jgi:hypothetical protein